MDESKIRTDEYGTRWSTVDYLPTNIEISDDGRVIEHVTASTFEEIKGSISSGYRFVSIRGNQYAVHRLVAEAFIDNVENFLIVKHKDEDRLNNKVDNLEWVEKNSSVASNYQKGLMGKSRVYCKETDQLFGSVQTAALVTGLPEVLVSDSIHTGATYAGMTFKNVSKDNELLTDNNLIYISLADAKELAKNCKDATTMRKRIKSIVNLQTKR